jgi:hypothetical protein
MHRRRWIVILGFVLLLAAGGVWLAFGDDDVPPPEPAANEAFHGVPERPGEPIVVWAIGDGAIDSPGAAAVGRLIARDDPDRVLYLGDVYEEGTPEEFKDGMTRVFGPLLTRILPTPGNHEWPNHLVGYDPYWEEVTGEKTAPWYAARLGDWQVLSLNSEAPHEPGSQQLRFLRKRVTGPSTCRIAFWHRPRFSAGTHGDQPDIEPLWDAVVGRAALVINGHDHDVQRLHPIDGTTEIVSGAGGRNHYPVDESDDRLAFSNDTANAALRIELDGTVAILRVVTARGRTIDRDRVTCSGPG